MKKSRLSISLATCLALLGACSHPAKDHEPEALAAAAQDSVRAGYRIPDDEQKYIGALTGYLNSTNDENLRLATMMGGASTGEYTLTEVKRAIERAQRIHSAAFHGDYKSARVPLQYVGIDAKITECNRLHQAAFEEYLQYWRDQNLAHITSGGAVFERAALVQQECVRLMRGRLAELKAAGAHK